MGRTIAEKILARASGNEEVQPGDFVTANVDFHYVLEKGLNEVHNTLVEAGLRNGLPKVRNPDKIAVFPGDHEGCHAKPQDAAAYKVSRELAKRYGIAKIYDIDTGIAHVVIPEEGLARPGMLVCGKDSHSTTPGAVNALATVVGTIETAWIYLTGEIWFRVPESIRLVCEGKLREGVTAKDMFLYVIGKYTPSIAIYKSVEWKGPVIDSMCMDGRLTLACQSLELGAKCAPFEPDVTCQEYLASTPHGTEPCWPTTADSDAVYVKVLEEDFTDLEPQVALPHGFEVIKPVSEVEGIKIDQCNMGSCANGRYDDMAIVARIVEGREVKVRTVFAPGSWRVYRKALESGVLATLIDAGVMVDSPTCGPCSARSASIADGEVAIGATTRNFRGRYGSPDAVIYLASPATAAASAIRGKITDPRNFL